MRSTTVQQETFTHFPLAFGHIFSKNRKSVYLFISLRLGIPDLRTNTIIAAEVQPSPPLPHLSLLTV